MSFRKFKEGAKQPASGTRISIINGQTLTSSGVASLDELIGGGIPMGKIMLIKSDRYTGYGHLLLKYFIAQGIAHQQIVSLSSLDMQPESIFEGLMGIVKGKQESTIEEDNNEKEDEYIPQLSGVSGLRPMGALRNQNDRARGSSHTKAAMSIAWRYQRLPQFSTALNNDFKGPNNSTYCHTFDLTKKIERDILNNASLYLNGPENIFPRSSLGTNRYQALLDKLQLEIKSHKESQLASESIKKVLRIGLHNLGSPSWGSDSLSELFIFLLALKDLIDGSYIVVSITIPSYLYNDFHNLSVNPFIRRIEYIADCVLEIESFSGTPNYVDEKYVSDYHGLIHAHSIFANDSAKQSTRLSTVELNSLGFKVRRKRFLIEQFTLPPEEEDQADDSKSKSSSVLSKPSAGIKASCASSITSRDPLEF